MSKLVITHEMVDASYILGAMDWLLEEKLDCFTCSEAFEDGDQVLDINLDGVVSNRRVITTIHLLCYQGEDIRA